MSNAPKAPQMPLTAEQVAANTARLEKCQAAVTAARAQRVIYSTKNMPSYIEVGPAFYELPVGEKQAVADLVNCVAVGGDNTCHVTYGLLDYRTGKAVAYYVNDGVLDLQ